MDPAATDRASDDCVHFASRDDANAVNRRHRGHAFGVYDVDASAIESKHALLSAVATAMHFPDDFGMNWDALIDSLRDMSWDVREGYVLILHDADRLFAKAPGVAEEFVSCCRAAAAEWARDGVPFHLVVAR